MSFRARLAGLRRTFEASRLGKCPDCRGAAIGFEFDQTDAVGRVPYRGGPCETCGRIRTAIRFGRIRGVSIDEAERRYRQRQSERKEQDE